MQSLLAGLLTFTALVQNMAASVQGSARYVIDLTVGSVTRALIESSASLGLWIQWLILQVAALTRAATSNGADLDSWLDDFGMARLAGSPAVGNVTFSRYNSTSAALIPAGATVVTADGTQTFAVVIDTRNSAWAPAFAGYNLAAGTANITLPVQAVVTGSAGNVTAGAITLMSQAVASVDSVTNADPMAGGVDSETDEAVRARFPLWVNSRTQGTLTAVDYAIASVSPGLSYTITENRDTDGNYTPGSFVVTIDDGSGATPGGTVAVVNAAVNEIRPIGSVVYVQAATMLTADVSLAIVTNSTVTHSTVVAQVVIAVTAYIAALPIQGPLPISRIAQVAYDTSPGIINVFAVTINSGTDDLVPTAFQVVRAGTVACT